MKQRKSYFHGLQGASRPVAPASAIKNIIDELQRKLLHCRNYATESSQSETIQCDAFSIAVQTRSMAVDEEYKWRQLGSIVNTVLLDARTKAMRSGSISQPQGVFVERSADTQRDWMADDRYQASGENQASSISRLKQLSFPFADEIQSSARKRHGAKSRPRRAMH